MTVVGLTFEQALSSLHIFGKDNVPRSYIVYPNYYWNNEQWDLLFKLPLDKKVCFMICIVVNAIHIFLISLILQESEVHYIKFSFGTRNNSTITLFFGRLVIEYYCLVDSFLGIFF